MPDYNFPEDETRTSARVVADSISEAGHRVTTIVATYPRIIHAEVLTHRVLSRSAASTRAIPGEKYRRKIDVHPFEPIVWGAEQAGMQVGGELTGRDLARAQRLWDDCRQGALGAIEEYHADLALDYPDPVERKAHTLHKSVINRLPEPFTWMTVIITATEWGNFFRQRVSPLAEPHVELAARSIMTAIHDSEPRKLSDGGWHLPFITDGERATHSDGLLKAFSVARCARVSFLNHDGTYDEAADLKLFERLCNPGDGPPHAAPLEHVCTPDPANVAWVGFDDAGRLVQYLGKPEIMDGRFEVPLLGNFTGWRQLRHEVLGF